MTFLLLAKFKPICFIHTIFTLDFGELKRDADFFPIIIIFLINMAAKYSF